MPLEADSRMIFCRVIEITEVNHKHRLQTWAKKKNWSPVSWFMIDHHVDSSVFAFTLLWELNVFNCWVPILLNIVPEISLVIVGMIVILFVGHSRSKNSPSNGERAVQWWHFSCLICCVENLMSTQVQFGKLKPIKRGAQFTSQVSRTSNFEAKGLKQSSEVCYTPLVFQNLEINTNRHRKIN